MAPAEKRGGAPNDFACLFPSFLFLSSFYKQFLGRSIFTSFLTFLFYFIFNDEGYEMEMALLRVGWEYIGVERNNFIGAWVLEKSRQEYLIRTIYLKGL